MGPHLAKYNTNIFLIILQSTTSIVSKKLFKALILAPKPRKSLKGSGFILSFFNIFHHILQMSAKIQSEQISNNTERKTIIDDQQQQQTDRQLKIPKLAQEQSQVGGLLNQHPLTLYQKCKPIIFGLVSIAIGTVLYLNHLSLKEHCLQFNQWECVKKFIRPKMQTWIIKHIVDSILGIFQLHFLVSGTTFRIIPLLGMVEMAYLYVFSDQSITFNYYIGAFNFVHVVFFLIVMLFYMILMAFVFCFRRKRKVFYVAITVFLITALYFYNGVVINSCDYWEKGINGQIEKIDGVCNIKTPSICWYKILNGKVKLNLLIDNCYYGEQAKEFFNRFFVKPSDKGKFIAFANPITFTDIQLYDQFLQGTVFKYAKGFKTLQAAKQSPGKPDIVFDAQNQVYHIDVQKNENLIQQRKQIWQKEQLSESPPLAKNVLFLFTDTIGRQSMHLKLPKVVSWFQKQTVQKSYFQNVTSQIRKHATQNQIGSKGQAYEFYRYNSLISFTQQNLLAMYNGYRVKGSSFQDVKNKMLPSVVKYFKDRGFITGSSNTLCQVNSVSTSSPYYNAFDSSHYDHQSQAFACDPNFQDPINPYTYLKGHSSFGKRCLYGKTMSQYASQYAQSFFKKYRDQPKLFSMHFLEGHQISGQTANTLNEPISNLIKKLDRKGYLEDTIVMLVSDHGMHMLFELPVQNYLTQRNLPTMMIRLPEKMNKKYRNKIRINQQYVVTSMNIHHFLKHIALGEKYQGKDKSLLADLTDITSCEKADVFAPQHCSCK